MKITVSRDGEMIKVYHNSHGVRVDNVNKTVTIHDNDTGEIIRKYEMFDSHLSWFNRNSDNAEIFVELEVGKNLLN